MLYNQLAILMGEDLILKSVTIKASSDDEYGDDNYEDPFKDNDNECDCPDDDDDYYEEPPREEEDER
jgi:hypothetical protein